MGFEVCEGGAVAKAAVGGVASEFEVSDFAVWQGFDALPTFEVSATNRRPNGEPARRVGGWRFEAEGERAGAAKREDGAEEIVLLRSHLGEAVEPQARDGNEKLGVGSW